MRKQLIIAVMILLLTFSVSLRAGGIHFGMVSAVKNKVEEIKAEKEKKKLPSIAITGLADSSKVSGIVTITTEAINVVKVEFYIDGVLKATDTAEPYSYILDTTQFTDGSHTLKAKAYDAANQTTSIQYSVTVDNTGSDNLPAISISSPMDGATVSGAVTVTTTATDDKGVAKVEFYIDDVLKSSDTAAPYSYSWDSTQYSNGTHIIKATVYDTVNQTASSQSSVIVNNVSGDNVPTITLTAPVDGATVSGTVSITADASDDEGVSKVEFYVDGALKSTDTTSSYSYSWNTTQYSNGAHTIKAIVYDTVNQTASSQYSVTVTNVSGDAAPTITLTAPVDGATVSDVMIVTADANDDKGIARVDFYIDGSYKESDNTAPYSYSWDTTQYNNSAHTVAAMAIDTSSQAASVQYSVIVYNITGVWQIQTVDSTDDVGWYTAITFDSNNYPHISYQGYTNKDLKYAKWTGSAWSIETVDSVGDVGSYTSIALDGNNYPRISYYDETNKDLKYARWTGSAWSIETVDSTGDVGWESSLTLDTNYYPHIAYYDYANKDLKYAKWTGLAWSIETVDSTGDAGRYPSIVLDTNKYPRIAYTNQNLKYAKWTGSAWNIETVDSAVFVGAYSSMKLDNNDYPHISYYDSTHTALKYTKWTGLAWSIETVEQALDIGMYSSLDLDTNQYPHIAYYNYSSYHLKYARWNGSSWSKETIDSTGHVGAHTSMELDTNNHPHIAYFDGTNRDLKYATR